MDQSHRAGGVCITDSSSSNFSPDVPWSALPPSPPPPHCIVHHAALWKRGSCHLWTALAGCREAGSHHAATDAHYPLPLSSGLPPKLSLFMETGTPRNMHLEAGTSTVRPRCPVSVRLSEHPAQRPPPAPRHCCNPLPSGSSAPRTSSVDLLYSHGATDPIVDSIVLA